MNLNALPAFSENCIWMIDDGHRAIVVDPGEPGPVIAALDTSRLGLAAILVTHHFADHVGGAYALRSRFTRLKAPRLRCSFRSASSATCGGRGACAVATRR